MTIEEAKIKYPLGTKFKSPSSETVGIVLSEIKSQGTNLYCSAKENGDQLYIYYGGKEAPIISHPIDKTKTFKIFN